MNKNLLVCVKKKRKEKAALKCFVSGDQWRKHHQASTLQCTGALFSCLEGKSIIQALCLISRLRIFEMYYKVMLRWGYFCLRNCLEMQVQDSSTYRATGVVQITSAGATWKIAVPHLEFDLAESISLMWQGFYFPPWQLSAVWLVDDATSNDPANWTISLFHFFPNAAPPNVRIIHSGHACNIEEERYTERVYTIREGETLELTCLVSGHPRPQVRLWVFTDFWPLQSSARGCS